jgi:ribonuclease VapC
MIVVDASALIAILDKEPDAPLYAEAIAEADPPIISAATLLEVNIVMLNRHGVKAVRMVDRLIIADLNSSTPTRFQPTSNCNDCYV